MALLISSRRGVPHYAFSLVELVVVVMIIAILAAVAVPKLTTLTAESQSRALHRSLIVVAEAAERYHAEHGQWPQASEDGTNPLDAYVTDRTFSSAPPGSVSSGAALSWRPALNSVGAGVAATLISPVGAQKLDDEFDDGNPMTGAIRRATVTTQDHGRTETVYYLMTPSAPNWPVSLAGADMFSSKPVVPSAP